MKNTWKKLRVGFIAAGMALCMTAGLGIGIYWSRGQAEKTAMAAAERELAFDTEEPEEIGQVYQPRIDEESLYKDVVSDTDLAKEVCDKYGLDYDTVKNKDITREMRNYEEALWLTKEMGSCPLLGSASGKGAFLGAFSSLEMYINEIYAFGGGEAVIKEMCADFGINPNTAVISDLTAEQLIKIGEVAFDTSDHPKE